MSESKFTPGPWFVGEVRDDADGDERQIDTGPGGAVICSVWPMGVDFDEPPTAPEREANARLIAKAPELHAALAEEGDRIAQWYSVLKVLYARGLIKTDAGAADLEDVIDGLAISGDKITRLLAEVRGDV